MALGTACYAGRPPHSAGPGTSAPSPAAPTAVRPPTANAVFDYQLGGAYPPPDKVRAVSRDRTAKPAPGRYPGTADSCPGRAGRSGRSGQAFRVGRIARAGAVPRYP